MKIKQKLTIGETDIMSLRFPKRKIKKIKNWGKSYENTINKAIAGKKLTINQSHQLREVHLVAIDFPIVSNSIICQLIDSYEERMALWVSMEAYENASEFRDIIISLKEISNEKLLQ